MKTYFSRLWWYIAVGLFLVSSFMLPTQFMVRGLLEAILIYLPVSVIWTFLSPVFYRQYGYSDKTFSIPSEQVGYGVLGIGIVLVASYIGFSQIDVAKLGFVLAFAGVDWILTVREGKERNRRNHSASHP